MLWLASITKPEYRNSMGKKRIPPSTATSSSLDPMYHLWGWIVIAWALYRYFFQLPEWADEFIFKPLVFVLPVLWYVRHREKRSLSSVGITTKNIFTSIYIGLGFGFIFALEGILANAVSTADCRFCQTHHLKNWG